LQGGGPRSSSASAETEETVRRLNFAASSSKLFARAPRASGVAARGNSKAQQPTHNQTVDQADEVEMTLNEHLATLSDEELERLALFAAGLALGLALVVIVRAIVEEWVISSDLADRERVREILREMLDKRRDSEPQESPPPIRTGYSITQNAAAAGRLDS
jgi:hypothetical protein